VTTNAQDTDPTTPAAPSAKPEATPAPKGEDKKGGDPAADKQLEKLATESEKEDAAKGEKGEAGEEQVKPAKESKEKKKGKKKEDSGTFRPDFRDQEIQDILKIFSKIIGKNIIADEKVKGKITVISPYKIPRSLAYPYLYSMLSIKGFGIVEENENLIRVVAVKDALAGSHLIYIGRDEIKDNENKSDLPVTQIVPVYGSKPSRLSAILKRLTSANTDLIDYDDIGMLIISGSTYEVNRLIKVTNLIDFKPEAGPCPKENPNCEVSTPDRNVHVYRLENMQAENVEATLKKIQLPIELPTPAPAASGGTAPAPTVTQANLQKKPIDVVGHKETNSIIFVGSVEEFDLVKGLIKRIDLPRQQVFLEVLIVEVNVSTTNTFGIDWLVGKGATGQFNSGEIALKSGFIAQDGTVNTGKPSSLPGFTMTFANDSITSILGILNAHVGKSNLLVVSAPQVLTLDNQEAEINVGQDQPVRVNTLTTAVGGINQSQSFEYRPTGVKLKFTPQVNKNRMITLNLFQEIKDVSGTDASSGNPIISKKDIKTFVRVQDGQTIVIGGLISNNRNTAMKKVPILGDLPLIGYLFKRIGTDSTRKNLMVFITPHILTNRALADKVTEELRQDQIREQKRGRID